MPIINSNLNKYDKIQPQFKPSLFLDHLEKRGLLQDLTPGLKNHLIASEESGKPARVYVGFDPSSASLQIGNMLAALLLKRAMYFGLQPVVLLGGATGLVGDPSGKKEERNLMEKETAHQNIERIRTQLTKLVGSEGPHLPLFVNNYEWFKNFGFLDFLRDVGKHITINYMTAKESVKIRMETGISYAEFGYMLIQGYDFLHLFENQNCTIQMGGSDQWGNMTTGLELIRRKHQKEAHALSSPLLTDSAGNKLGKTDSGAIYLDPNMTSPYKFYQFWLNQADADIPNLLNRLTLFTDEAIGEILVLSQREPEKRHGQRILAEELTGFLHGVESAQSADKASRVLFSKEDSVFAEMSPADLSFLSKEVPSTHLDDSRLERGIGILDLLVETKLAASKGDARRNIKGGAISLNRKKITDETQLIRKSEISSRGFFLLGSGKSNVHLVLF